MPHAAASARATSGAMRRVVLRLDERRLEIEEAAWPRPAEDEVLCRSLLVGVDGTDEEILAGEHGEAPQDRAWIVPGHECLGEVLEAPEGSDLAPGDRVVPLVRHGCGGCEACARVAPDLCPTDAYREHGIRGLDGFLQDAWTDDPSTLVRVPPGLGRSAVLAEPLSVVVKALEVAVGIQRRIPWFDGFRGGRALVAGTGSLGSLAAFLLRHEGMEVVAVDRTSDDAFGAQLLRAIGAGHVDGRGTSFAQLAKDVGPFDLAIEATGSPKVTFEVAETLDRNGVLVLLGVPAEREPIEVDADAFMRGLVLGNRVVAGSVNSNRRHFEEALRRLQGFEERWGDAVGRVLTHTFAPEEAEEAFRFDHPDLVKKAVVFDDGA